MKFASLRDNTDTSGPSSLLDANGTAIVIYALPDDQQTDPAGNAGARVACGVPSLLPGIPGESVTRTRWRRVTNR